jgi:hypothetical protein
MHFVAHYMGNVKYNSEKKNCKVQHIYTYFNTNEKRKDMKMKKKKKRKKKKKKENANTFLDDVTC